MTIRFAWGSMLVFSVIAAVANDAQPFKATSHRDNDRIELKVESGKMICSVKSPSGISHAVLERTGDSWPDAIVLRLYLGGLESLQVTNGKIKLSAAVSSQDGNVRVWMADDRSQLNVSSPLWMDIRRVDTDAKTRRGEDGYFEVSLPRSLIEDNPKSLTCKWIDFYRN